MNGRADTLCSGSFKFGTGQRRILCISVLRFPSCFTILFLYVPYKHYAFMSEHDVMRMRGMRREGLRALYLLYGRGVAVVMTRSFRV